MSRKSFKSKPRLGNGTFDIEGVEFTYKRDVPGAVIMDFMSAVDADNPATMVKVIDSLFSSMLVEGDIDRFNTYIRDPENNIGMDELMGVAEWLVEEASGNETQQGLSGPG